MYNTILFDLDGTLTESAQGIINSVLYALNKMNIPVRSDVDHQKFIGPPLHESFKKYYDFDDESARNAVPIYREYFTTKGMFEAPLYDDVIKMLQTLKDHGKSLYVATSKPEVFAKKILNYVQADEYFTDIVGALLNETRLKKDEVIAHLLEKNNIRDLSEVIMVGDREHDIIGAKSFGIDSIGVLYGYGDRDELETAGATYIAETPMDIAEIILNADA